MKKKKALVSFGTRPEAIKLGPVINELGKSHEIKPVVCVSGQHKELLEQVLECFGIEPEYNLSIMRKAQSLFGLTSKLLESFEKVLSIEQPDVVIIHGDTTTAFASALGAFYKGIPVAHVEAGLRSGNLSSPFPEEFNRIAAGIIAKLHFAPTEQARENLIRENRPEGSIYVTGNTAIDALSYTVKEGYSHFELSKAEGKRIALLTAHRRESWGEPLQCIFDAAKELLERYPDLYLIYPVHPNPVVFDAAHKAFSGVGRARLIEPLGPVDFHNFMKASYIILTDSGGIQEEAPSLGKPTLVLRDTTERPEGLACGALKLVGTQKQSIINAASRLLSDRSEYTKMQNAPNPFGDGKAAQRIVRILERELA
ncbi:MAG: UDP-N-acetylglucosamine 2-epimerase (non-hydrolyzing) [Eubacteriaceae bacterium]|nr:UDP-N-acetylglucosamine 2-epimerase (non-hydrolyzing) [Eubacteriaceae bacterium]